MHIESPEVFRQWLTSVLGPLCDADPEALAKYVHALVRKDKPINELKDSMITQLDVFLQGETKGFVALLFKTIESKEYTTFKKEDDKKEEPSSSVGPTTTNVETSAVPPDEPITSTDEKQTTQIQSCVVSEGTVKESPVKPEKREEKRLEAERDDRGRQHRSRLKRDGPAWQQRSRSRSWDRSRRSRSRDRAGSMDRERDRDMDRRGRPYRNKSPPRRFERRRSYSSRSPSPGRYRPSSRSKSRSPKFQRRFRNKSPGHSRSRSRSRDSSRSFDRKKSPKVSELSKDIDSRLSMGKKPLTGRRCRDYDVQGFCMLGELCQYDHGTDPVVVKDLNPPLSYGNGPPGHNVPPIAPPMGAPMPGIGPPSFMQFQHPPPVILRPPPTVEYNPDAPELGPLQWARPPFMPRGPNRMMHGIGGFPGNQRELISVPMDSRGAYRNDVIYKDLKRSGHDRGGNCCLVIKKIPPPLNNITHLNNHFAKFGKIINIQVNYSNDPEAAMVTFSSPTEAKAAHKSTEAVLNNRFIKVFWHSDNKDGTRSGSSNIKDRLTGQSTTTTSTSDGTVTVTTATSIVKKPMVAVDPFKREKGGEDQKAKALAQLKKSQEILEKNQILRKKTEITRKEVIQISTELRKRSQNLLEKQIEQQKKLLDRLENGELDEKQRNALKEAIKLLQDSIEKLKTELLESTKQIKKPVPVKKTKDEIQKEILDTELDLITKQQEGGDLLPLQKKLGMLKLELLKIETKSMIPPHMRSSARSLIKNPMSPHLTLVRRNSSKLNFPAPVDHRPSKILVSGYENDEQDLVLAHFRGFGEIGDYIADDSTPSIVLNFKTRQEAEAAMNKGKNFQDRLLTVTWFTTPHLTTRRRNSSASGPTYHMHAARQVHLRTSDSDVDQDAQHDLENEIDQTIESTEDFLLQDDDEDGDEEERSWRR